MWRLLSQTALYAVLCWLALGTLPGATSIRLSHSSTASALVIGQMQRELGRIAKPTGRSFAFVDSEQAAPGRRVSVRLLGDCTGVLSLSSTRGPLGWTKVIDGRILPYVEVDCDRVRATILPDIERQGPVLREAALGRALARVLAHELRHALARTLDHEDHGPARASLGSRDLLYGSYRLTADDLEPLARVESPAPGEPASVASEPGPTDFPIDTGR